MSIPAAHKPGFKADQGTLRYELDQRIAAVKVCLVAAQEAGSEAEIVKFLRRFQALALQRHRILSRRPE